MLHVTVSPYTIFLLLLGVLFLVMSVMSKGDVKPLKQKKSKGPQPKWAILQAMNYIVLAVFVSSITFAISSPKSLLSRDEETNSPIKTG